MNPETKYQEAPPPYSQPPHLQQQYPQGQGPPPQGIVDPTADPAYGYDDKPILVQPGVVVTTPEPYANVPDYLALSIVSILFCTILGIVSIIKSSNARQMQAAGRYQTALAEANKAKTTAICGIVIGAILIILMVVIRVSVQV